MNLFLQILALTLASSGALASMMVINTTLSLLHLIRFQPDILLQVKQIRLGLAVDYF